jgi:dTDP-4-dehydrorhamnose reductase
VWEIAQNFESMPPLLHLGGQNSWSFFELMVFISSELGVVNPNLIRRRTHEIKDHPRPLNCGFDTSLATASGISISHISDSVERLVQEYASV